MAEALAIIGLVSSIVQFVEFSSKIIERLNEFQSGIDEVPQTFRDLKIQLPLLRETLKKTKTHTEAGFIDTDVQTAILNVVKGCQEQVELLDNILVKTLPATGDSRIRRGVKAFSSVGQEKEVQKIVARIQQYQVSLIHYQTTPATQALPTRSRPLFTVPFAQDPRFTGRQGLIDDIDKHFKIHRRVALAGLGGVGKSQIAIEYCYRFKKSHPQSSIMWIHASTVERIDQAYKEIARKAQLPGWDNPKTDALTLVVNWLSQDESGHWLIVLDNADDADVFFSTNHDLLSKESKGKPIASYIPHSTQGSVLITTRDRRVGERLANRVRAINVPPFTVQEAGDLLGSLVGKIDVGDEANAQELLDALAYLPLAVSQAAAFITENGITVSEYLELLRAGDADIKDLLSEELTDSRRDAETQNSVIQTWKLSFDHIRRSNPRAAKILSLMSVLDRQGIPKSLLRQDNDKSIEFTKAIGVLQAFSLITTENSGISFEIHRLVHLATQKWLELQGEMNLWREEALKVVSEVYPVGIFENWAVCNSLGPHMQAVIEYTFDSKTCQLYSATLLSNAIQYDLKQGRYDIALDKCTKALTIRKDLLGPEHPDTLTSMADLASTYRNQGRWKEAEGLEVQVMETRKRILGQEHPDTLKSMSNLAWTYWNQGRWKEAEGLEVQVMETSKIVLGQEHPDTLTRMANLAVTYEDQGRWKEAEALGVQVMETRKRVLRREHPDTLMSMANLAVTYEDQGRWKEAEELGVQVMETRKRVLGQEHPDTLTSMAILASTYSNQGRWKEAEGLGVQVVETRKRVLGQEHPDTLKSMSVLASTYWNQGRWKEAEGLEVQVMETRKRVLGQEHPDTLTSFHNLAYTWKSQGRDTEAIDLMRQAERLRRTTLGFDHPLTISSTQTLCKWQGPVETDV